MNTVPSITLHSLNINFFFFHNTHTHLPHRSQWIGVFLFLPFFLYFHFRLEFYYCIRNGFTFFIIFIWGGCIFPFFYNVTFTLFLFSCFLISFYKLFSFLHSVHTLSGPVKYLLYILFGFFVASVFCSCFLFIFISLFNLFCLFFVLIMGIC